jgi:hypothetical protein
MKTNASDRRENDVGGELRMAEVEEREGADAARDNEEHELEAEEESAAAMDADVPQPPDASRTDEGQPS